MKDYADSELLELLPIEELVRFLRLKSSVEERAEVAPSPRVTVPESCCIPTGANDEPLSALKLAVSMAEGLRTAMVDSLQSQEQYEKDQSIKLAEAEALRIEVNASPLCVYWYT